MCPIKIVIIKSLFLHVFNALLTPTQSKHIYKRSKIKRRNDRVEEPVFPGVRSLSETREYMLSCWGHCTDNLRQWGQNASLLVACLMSQGKKQLLAGTGGFAQLQVCGVVEAVVYERSSNSFSSVPVKVLLFQTVSWGDKYRDVLNTHSKCSHLE